MPQLDPTWFASQLFWLFISFSLLYLVLSRLLKPLMGMVEEREQTVGGDLSQAERIREQAAHTQQAYEQMMNETRMNAQALINEALLAQKTRAEQSLKDLDKQVEKKLTESSKKIAAHKAELFAALQPAISDLVISIVTKLTESAPSQDKVKRAISGLTNKE